MKAYMKGITKEQFVAETKLHQKLDHFVRGTYSEGERGCAVGCAIKSINKIKGLQLKCSNHRQLEVHGICPQWLAELQDKIFEGVSVDRSKVWPVEFAEAINQGADLDMIKTPFLLYVLEQNIKNQEENLKHNPDMVNIIQPVIDANIKMFYAQKSGDVAEIQAAARFARSAVRSAAWSAAEVEWSAVEAVRSAAWSAVGAAESAAESAAEVAEAVRSAARSAAEAEWSATFELYADKLLRLIRGCK